MPAYSFPCLTNMPEMSGFNLAALSNSASSSHQLLGVSPSNTSWERRCLRKHRRRADDEGCSAKRRRLMGDGRCDPSGHNSSPSMCQNWPAGTDCSLSEPPTSVLPQACPGSQDLGLPLARSSSPQPRQETEASCMEVEAAQRRLQEIEERITLEDDDEDEDLEVEPAPRPPILVMSDSLREGLQRGISDILPHKVAQSMSHSCMELVVWRPPEDALSRRLKDSLQRQRKQQTAGRQPPHPSPSPSPHSPLSSAGASQAYPPAFSSPGAHSSGEEDMEL